MPQLGTFIVKVPEGGVVFSELLRRDDGILRGLLVQQGGMNDLEAAGAIDRFHCDVIDFGFAVDTDGTITKRLVDDLPHDRTFTLAELPQLLLTQPNAWSRCWKRSLFLDTGIRYPSRVWYEDIRTTTKLFAAAGSICAVPDVFYYLSLIHI